MYTYIYTYPILISYIFHTHTAKNATTATRPPSSGGTLIKHRHLKLLGYDLVTIPYWEWEHVSRHAKVMTNTTPRESCLLYDMLT